MIRSCTNLFIICYITDLIFLTKNIFLVFKTLQNKSKNFRTSRLSQTLNGRVMCHLRHLQFCVCKKCADDIAIHILCRFTHIVFSSGGGGSSLRLACSTREQGEHVCLAVTGQSTHNVEPIHEWKFPQLQYYVTRRRPRHLSVYEVKTILADMCVSRRTQTQFLHICPRGIFVFC